MNWRTVKFDWNRVRAFVVTAEEGSLSAAARALCPSSNNMRPQSVFSNGVSGSSVVSY